MYKIKILTEDDFEELENFCFQCRLEGIKNNSSFEQMKIHQILQEGGLFWIAIYNLEIVSISGVHNFSNFYPNSFRIGFRTATLSKHRRSNSPSKKNFNESIQYGSIYPLQIKYCIEQNVTPLLTTNLSNIYADSLFHRLELKGMCVKLDRREIFNTDQHVWKILPSGWII